MSGVWSERVAALGDAAPATRGGRLLRRAAGQTIVGPSALAAVPAWLGWPAPRRARLGAAAALLAHRAALDREISASRLAPLAALVGEDLFDALCDAPRPDVGGAGALPGPAALSAEGEALLARALPAVLGGGGDAQAARLVGTVAALAAQCEPRA